VSDRQKEGHVTDTRKTVTYGDIVFPLSNPAVAFMSPSVAGGTVTGAYGVNTMFWSNGPGSTLASGGGGSDNTFYVYSMLDNVVPSATDGVDTLVVGAAAFVAPPGISIIQLTVSGSVTGNAGTDLLTATGSGQHTLIAGTGTDVLVGSDTGSDRFVVSSGGSSDFIAGFQHGTDIAQINDPQLASFAEVQEAFTQQGDDAVLDMGDGKTLTFIGANISDFTAADFALPFSTAGLKLTFDDEFNSLSASPNGAGTTWMSTYYNGQRTHGQEAQYFSDSSVGVNPFSLANGILTITAASGSNPVGLPYNSGVLTTYQSFSQEYGFFEIRAALPSGQGAWPAFWMLPANGSWPPELDVFEAIGTASPGNVYVTTHSAATGSNVMNAQLVQVPGGIGAFHTYGVDWEPATITFYIDGNAVASMPTPTDMHQPMYMLMDLAMGTQGSWPGAAPTNGPAQQMQVDYVRAFATAATIPASTDLVVTGWGMNLWRGDGNYTVTGNGSGASVTLGNGNQVVNLTGSQSNSVVLGNGNSIVTMSGSYNKITAGNGDDTIQLSGSSNVVSVGSGTSTIVGGSGHATITAAGGGQGDTITVSGWSNLVDIGPGLNFINTNGNNSGSGYDTLRLNGAGQGLDRITGFTPWNGDVLDLSRTLAGLNVATDLSNLGTFVSATSSNGNTTLYVDPSGGQGGTPVAFAVLEGSVTTLSTLVANHDIKV
jgi:beta-glucanase (GH16 family)